MSAQNKIAVLGGFGFLGSHLVEYLVAQHHHVVVFGRESSVSPTHTTLPDVDYVYGDFSNIEDTRRAISGAQVVYHLIGNTVPQSSNENPAFDLISNAVPTIALLDLCVEEGVEHLVFTSSGGTVYGVSEPSPIDENYPKFPICSYGIQKLMIEHYMRLYHRLSGIHMTILRISNPYGPGQTAKRGQGIIGSFCQRIKREHPLEIWGDGSIVRDYIYIDDVIQAMGVVMTAQKGFGIYNVGTGIGTSVSKLVKYLTEISPRQVDADYFPSRPADVPVNILDSSLFKSTFKWQPKWDIRSGLKATLAWHLDSMN